VGFIVGKTLVKCGVRRPGSLWGSVLGAGIGGVALAGFVNPERAAIGLLSGAILGAVLAVILVLLFFVSLAMVQVRESDRK
jgi:ethanolamine transporter EutH